MHRQATLDHAPALPLDRRAFLALRVRHLWQQLRAAARVLVLFRRRRLATRGGVGAAAASVQTPRRLKAPPPPIAGAAAGFAQGYVPLGDGGYAQKLEVFRRVVSKPLHARSDVDIKLIADFLVNAKFAAGLPSPSVDELARSTRFRTVHDGEVLFRQGDAIIDTSARYMVMRGSLMVFRNAQYAREASEGEEYEQWFKRVCTTTGGLSAAGIRYGDCINTCGAGDTCGDDAFKGPIFRTTTAVSQTATVVAFVTQADYNRVARFQVEESAALAERVLDEFYPGGMPSFTDAAGPKRVGRQHSSDSSTARTWMRFLSSYECFRGLSGRYQLELANKLECKVLQSDQTRDPIALGSETTLLIVLRGQLCVHQTDTTEEAVLRKAESEDCGNGLRSVEQRARRGKTLRGSAPHTVNGVQVCGSCDHICSLSAGSSFGETAVLFESSSALTGVELFVPPSLVHSPSVSVVVLLLSHEVLANVRAQYLESLEFAQRTAHTILCRIHPRDRTGEQLTFLVEFLRRVLPARVFFQQLPARVLFEMCLHASVETFDMSNGREMECILKEGCAVDRLRVILNGHVAIFKSGRPMSETEGGEECIASVSHDTTREMLKREQSRLIRGTNLEESSLSSSKQSQHLDKTGTADPVGLLPFGACFGQLQLFTGSKSPYSYAAYSAGHASASLLHVLTLPGRIAKLCLSDVDDMLVYNPVRVLRRIIKAKSTSNREHWQLEQHMCGLNFERLLLNQAALVGLPRCRVTASVPTIRIVDVPAKHFIYETGESTRGALYVLLSGSARLFCFSERQSSPSHTSDNRRASPKFSAKVSALMRLKAAGVADSMPADSDTQLTIEGETLMDETPFVFDQRADDSFFSQGYSSARELVAGDGFGCCGDMDVDITAAVPQATYGVMPRKSSACAINGLPTTISPVYQDTAVAMTDCKIGVLFSGSASTNSRYRLSASEKAQIQSRFRHDEYQQPIKHDEENATLPELVLTLGLRTLEQAGLAGNLSSSQRFELVKNMKYCIIQNGDKVFQAGEEGQAVYLLVSGRVRIYGGVDGEHVAVRTRESVASAGTWSMLLDEGDTFGEEALLYGGGGCTRSVTAVADVNESGNAELLYLTRASFDQVYRQQATTIISASNDPSRGASSDPLFGFHKIAPLARWKRAVHHIIRQRTMRSQWYSVLCQARQHRAELVWNLVRDFEGWKDMRPDVALRLCAHATLNVFGHGAAVYSKDDAVIESVYVVVSGALAIQQPTTVTSAGQSLSIASGPYTTELTTARVVVRVLKQESCFGEFEFLVNSVKRVASAIVSSTEARVLSITKDAFLRLWPHRSQMKTKLQLLQRALLPILPLDDAQLCCLYYAIRERTFQREQVVSSAATPASTLFQIVASGMCVVHDSVTLQLRKQSQRGSKSPRRRKTLSLDTRLATLGPGAILFETSTHKDPSSPESRYGSMKEALSLGETGDTIDGETHPRTEYVVADSPLVTTLALELPPARRFLADVMLGRHGLDTACSAVAAHQKWRGSTGAEASLRLAVASVSKSSTLAPSPVRASLTANRVSSGTSPQSMFPSLSPAKLRIGIVQFLQGRELTTAPDISLPRDRPVSRALTAIEPSRVISFPSLQASRSPGCLPSGSFAVSSGNSSRVLSHIPEPVCPRDNTPAQSKEPYESRAEVTSRREHEQLRKEQTTVTLLSRHSRHLGRHKQASAERDKRHRHGRPPPTQVSTRTHFTDVFSASPPRMELSSDHEQKKSALVRRLLHIKPVSQ